MPRGDGSGPMGMGPMTGRGAGFCAGAVSPGYANPGGGYGCARGFRRNFFASGVPGRARFSGFGQANGTPIDEKELLNNRAKVLQEQLDDIKNRLAEL